MPDINSILTYSATALIAQGPLFLLIYKMGKDITKLQVQMDLLIQDRHASLKQRS